MGMGRAQHIEPQRALVGLVVDELPLPGEQPLVFQTLDRLARTETHIAGKNVHQFVLRASCRIGRVLAVFAPETTYSVHCNKCASAWGAATADGYDPSCKNAGSAAADVDDVDIDIARLRT